MKVAFKSYLSAIGWLITTMSTILRRQPAGFISASALMGVLRIVQFLVMILPLKVVLLAAHEGVPSYAPFISPEHKGEWIIGLAVGSIVAFIGSNMLDGLANRICHSAGTRLMEQSADLNVMPNQRDHARGIFSDFASVLADFTFWAIGMALYFMISPLTFSVYAILIVASLGIGTLLTIVGERRGLARAHRFIVEKTGIYLDINSSVIFFTCFLVILLPLVAGWPVNLLVALVSIMLLRRTLGALSDSVRGALKLIRKRHVVDALMFRHKQLVPKIDPGHQTLSTLFAPNKRLQLAKQLVAAIDEKKQVTSVDWQDPVVPPISLFLISCSDGSKYQLQAYPEKKAHALENEDALFSIVARKDLGAAGVAAAIDYGGYKCRVLEAGTGVEPDPDQWRSAHLDSIIRLVGMKPETELVDMFCSTHLLPHQRLNSEFLSRVKVALRGKADKRAYEGFARDLQSIRDRVDAVPLAIANTDFGRNGAVAIAEGLPLFMYWGRWALAPLGGGVMYSLNDDELAKVLAAVRHLRDDIDGNLSLDDLKLVSRVQNLVAQIEKGSYAAALDTILDIEALGSQRLLAAAE